MTLASIAIYILIRPSKICYVKAGDYLHSQFISAGDACGVGRRSASASQDVTLQCVSGVKSMACVPLAIFPRGKSGNGALTLLLQSVASG